MYDIDIYHITIASWSREFAHIFQEKASKLRHQTLCQSDE